jgi:hypothetical protein
MLTFLKKIYLFVICWNWIWFYNFSVYNEINNGLFNGYVSHLINFIFKLKISVNLEEFEFLKKIDNDLKVLLK